MTSSTDSNSPAAEGAAAPATPPSTAAATASPSLLGSAALNPTEWEGKILRANTAEFVDTEGALERTSQAQWSGAWFWMRWVLATTLGWTLAGIVSGTVAGSLGTYDDWRVDVVSYAMEAVTLGLQVLVLRRRMPGAWRWIAYSVPGVIVGALLYQGIQFLVRAGGTQSPGLEAVLSLVVEGMVTALAQWLLLRRIAPRAWRWLLANAVWIALLTPLFLFTASSDSTVDDPLAAAIGSGLTLAVLGLVASVINGAEMTWLLKRQKSAASTATTAAAPAS